MFSKSEHAILNLSGIIFINQEKIKYIIKESRRKFERNAFQTFYSGKISIIRASLDKPNSFLSISHRRSHTVSFKTIPIPICSFILAGC